MCHFKAEADGYDTFQDEKEERKSPIFPWLKCTRIKKNITFSDLPNQICCTNGTICIDYFEMP